MIIKTLNDMFPNVKCELEYHSKFQLLIAVILSAQTTDKAVNKVTKILFSKYPKIEQLATATDLEDIIKPLGIYRNKAKSIKEVANIISNQYQLIIPNTLSELMKLPGVGRKTANVVLSEGFNIAAFAVDTHVFRVSKRLRLASQSDAIFEVEKKLMAFFPKDKWHQVHQQLLHLGRYICLSKKPKCDICLFKDYCRK